MDGGCLFCNLKDNWIFENEHFYAVFDVHPISPGHALVIPKKHTVGLLDLDEHQWKALKDAIKSTIDIIENTCHKKLYENMMQKKPTKNSTFYCHKMLQHMAIEKKPEAYNIGNNDGEVAGRTIHHLHLQIIPRYKNDLQDCTGGIRRIFPELGNYTKDFNAAKKY